MSAIPKFFTLPEAAAVIGMNVNTLKKHVQLQEAAATMFGRVWFMTVDDIFNYLVEYNPERARTFAEQEQIAWQE